jgi:hypothetical protein
MCTHSILSPFSRRLSRGLCILLVIAVLAALLPTMASAAPSLAKLECDNTYEVRRGNSLHDIAALYGIAANQIVAANTWKKPYHLRRAADLHPTKTEKPPKVDSTIANTDALVFLQRTETGFSSAPITIPGHRRIRVDDASEAGNSSTLADQYRFGGQPESVALRRPPTCRCQPVIYLPERQIDGSRAVRLSRSVLEESLLLFAGQRHKG